MTSTLFLLQYLTALLDSTEPNSSQNNNDVMESDTTQETQYVEIGIQTCSPKQFVEIGTQTDNGNVCEIGIQTSDQATKTEGISLGTQVDFDTTDHDIQIKHFPIESSITKDHGYVGYPKTSTPLKVNLGIPPASPNLSYLPIDESMDASYTDNQVADSSYTPETESSSDSDSDQENTSKPVTDRRFLVDESQMDKLFQFCFLCHAPVTVIKKFSDGSNIHVRTECLNHHTDSWRSDSDINGMSGANILVAAAILFTGNTYSRISEVAELLNLNFMSRGTFYNIQSQYLFPVVHHTWEQHQEALFQCLSNQVLLAGDGRCDSPGHSAKYGTYSIMETSSSNVIDFEVVQVSEVKNSAGIEPEGLRRVLTRLTEHGINWVQLATDRHPTISSIMNKEFQDHNHEYDVWHVSKGLTKKITARASKKACIELSKWTKSITNHLWWSSKTCEGNYDLLREKWKSILFHIRNIHDWSCNDVYHRCEHSEITRDDQPKKWLKDDSEAYKELQALVTDKKLLKDMKKMTNFAHTGELEVFHSSQLKYLPKRQHFSYEGMVARTELAILANNLQRSSEQATTKDGNLRFKLVHPKSRKSWVVKPVYEKKNNYYLYQMLEMVVEVRLSGTAPKIKRQLPTLKENIAPTPRPDKQEAVSQHRSRFQTAD